MRVRGHGLCPFIHCMVSPRVTDGRWNQPLPATTVHCHHHTHRITVWRDADTARIKSSKPPRLQDRVSFWVRGCHPAALNDAWKITEKFGVLCLHHKPRHDRIIVLWWRYLHYLYYFSSLAINYWPVSQNDKPIFHQFCPIVLWMLNSISN